VQPHLLFTRNGFDVWCEIPVTFTQAALGIDLVVPTLDGKISYHMPAGTQPGEAFRLKGKGIQILNRSGRGDQYVRVTVEVPKNLNEKQKEILRQFDVLTADGGNNEKRKKFLDKLKDVMGYKL
jgi:molecular chaperone DnaJ